MCLKSERWNKDFVQISDVIFCLKSEQSVQISDVLVCSNQFGTEQKGPVWNLNMEICKLDYFWIKLSRLVLKFCFRSFGLGQMSPDFSALQISDVRISDIHCTWFSRRLTRANMEGKQSCDKTLASCINLKKIMDFYKGGRAEVLELVHKILLFKIIIIRDHQ